MLMVCGERNTRLLCRKIDRDWHRKRSRYIQIATDRHIDRRIYPRNRLNQSLSSPISLLEFGNQSSSVPLGTPELSGMCLSPTVNSNVGKLDDHPQCAGVLDHSIEIHDPARRGMMNPFQIMSPVRGVGPVWPPDGGGPQWHRTSALGIKE